MGELPGRLLRAGVEELDGCPARVRSSRSGWELTASRAWRGGALADLDEVAVGVADVCADLAAVVFGLGEELGSSGRPDLRCRGDVRDADVEEGADLGGGGRRGERDRGFVVGRAGAGVEDEQRVRYLQEDWIALGRVFPPEHGLCN